MLTRAHAVNEAAARRLRGSGALKPQNVAVIVPGLGDCGLRLLGRGGEGTGMRVVTELWTCVISTRVLEVDDVLQVGARNRQNYTLLTRDRPCGRPRSSSSAGCRAQLESL